MIKIDTNDADKKLSIVKKYFNEIIYVMLTFSVAYLYLVQASLQKELREYIQNDRIEVIKSITESNGVINANTAAFEKLYDLMAETKSQTKYAK